MADLRRLLPYVRPYWRQMLAATAALLVSSLVVLALPWAVSLLVDAVFSTGDQQLLTRIAVTLLGLFVLQSLLYLAEIYLLAFVGQRVVADSAPGDAAAAARPAPALLRQPPRRRAGVARHQRRGGDADRAHRNPHRVSARHRHLRRRPGADARAQLAAHPLHPRHDPAADR
jgi:hypothetical protein